MWRRGMTPVRPAMSGGGICIDERDTRLARIALYFFVHFRCNREQRALERGGCNRYSRSASSRET